MFNMHQLQGIVPVQQLQMGSGFCTKPVCVVCTQFTMKIA